MHQSIDRRHLQLGRALLVRSLYAVLAIYLACVAQHAFAASPSPITLTQQDEGKTVEAAVGQKIFVQLASNPTTGYQWSVVGNPAPLEFIKSDYAADPQAAGRIGAGGIQTLRFADKLPGKVELKLGYARPWEKDVAPAKTFTATIVVR
jgi:inhibitor of cysteine peptidase